MAALESGSIAAITKYGWFKLGGLLASLLGAALMAVFRPPKTRHELFLQAIVALGSSFLFGDFLATHLATSWNLINVSTATIEELVEYQIAIHGLIGATSWGIFGAIAHVRDKLEDGAEDLVKDVHGI